MSGLKLDLAALERARLADEQPDEPILPPNRLARWRRSEEVWRLRSSGMSTGQIAAALGVTIHTVKADVMVVKVRRGLRDPKTRRAEDA